MFKEDMIVIKTDGYYNAANYYNAAAQTKQKEKTQTNRKDANAKTQNASSVKLSEKAQDMLEKLRKKYKNMDFMAVDFEKEDEVKSVLSHGTKEFSVLFSSDELEKMASDEKYEKEYMNRIEGAVHMSDQINRRFGFESASGENDTQIMKIGIGLQKDGSTTFFAELEKSSAMQRERIEKAQEEKRTNRKRTTVQADSIEELLKKIKESPVGPKSSCPSPESFMQLYQGEEDHVYVVTLSKELSGSYNSAKLAKNLFEEEHGENSKKIYIFNSKSASVGETLIGMKVQECEEAGMSFEDTVAQVERYIEGQNTYFVLETLETLRKNGRLSNLKAFVANTLNIKPVMGSTPKGEICQLGQARGMKKALKLMIEEMLKGVKDSKNSILAISHCDCPENCRCRYCRNQQHVCQ